MRIDQETYLKTKREAAAHLGISLASLERLRYSGSLAYVRIGNLIRFRPEDLAAFIHQRRIQQLTMSPAINREAAR
jgi:excisionase family DNA binding protein